MVQAINRLMKDTQKATNHIDKNTSQLSRMSSNTLASSTDIEESIQTISIGAEKQKGEIVESVNVLATLLNEITEMGVFHKQEPIVADTIYTFNQIHDYMAHINQKIEKANTILLKAGTDKEIMENNMKRILGITESFVEETQEVAAKSEEQKEAAFNMNEMAKVLEEIVKDLEKSYQKFK